MKVFVRVCVCVCVWHSKYKALHYYMLLLTVSIPLRNFVTEHLYAHNQHFCMCVYVYMCATIFMGMFVGSGYDFAMFVNAATSLKLNFKCDRKQVCVSILTKF